MWCVGTSVASARHTYMENTICDSSDASIFFKMHHRHTSVMMSTNEKITILIIHFHIASSHAANPLFIHSLKISIRKNLKCFHTFISNRIKELSIL